MKKDEHQGQGGSFVMQDGKRVRMQEPTKPSDTGGARDAGGTPLPGTVPPRHERQPPPAEAVPPARQRKTATD
jgi:hypothetical protein